MVAQVKTVTFLGLNTHDVEVQVHIASGLPRFAIVGLPDKVVGESRDRITAAITSVGLSFPYKRVTVNLAPADLIKEGNHFDLPIACALLILLDVLPAEELQNFVILGELGLDGSIKSVNGVLPAAIKANADNIGIICPESNGVEATWAGDFPILAPKHLLSLVNHFNGRSILNRPAKGDIYREAHVGDMQDVRGQATAKRALEIAAAGEHNILLSGPPGIGKSLLASRFMTILPPLSTEEILECSMIASISGAIENGTLKCTRPFRAPHHSCSMPAMVGGGIGKRTQPGEVTLAHKGVLFLDELPEFPRIVLDALRQPIENGNVTVSRVNSHVTYPADFQLIAAMNPCRCGYFGDPAKQCTKVPKCAAEYQNKISGPLLDRYDMIVELPPVPLKDLMHSEVGETSSVIAERVSKARDTQKTRYKNINKSTNKQVSEKEIISNDMVTKEALTMLHTAMEKMQLSMRSYSRILRVARTIADLANSEKVMVEHITEALYYRPRNDNMLLV